MQELRLESDPSEFVFDPEEFEDSSDLSGEIKEQQMIYDEIYAGQVQDCQDWADYFTALDEDSQNNYKHALQTKELTSK